MSTYNGEEYLQEQINSILNQDYNEWDLYIRDDGSSDNTVNIILNNTLDTRIHYINDSTKHRGVRDSFLYLLNLIEADYYMFCDQDDFWLPDKISKELNAIIEIENTEGNSVPVIVGCDLQIVDKRLTTIHQSMWKQNHTLDLISDITNSILIAPIFPGCSMLFNRSAREIGLKIKPHKKTIHDNHLALSVITNDGHIIAVKEPLILYRQHENNVIGSYRGTHYVLSKFKSMISVIRTNYIQFKIVNHYSRTNMFRYLSLKMKHILSFNKK